MCELRDPRRPHTWVCATCGLEHAPGTHDFNLCRWRQEQRLYEHPELWHHPGCLPGAEASAERQP